jgi:predicted ester cyclase
MKSAFNGSCLVLAMLLIPGICGAQAINNHKNITKKESAMSTIERNKEVIVKLYEQALNARNTALLQELIADDYTGAQGKKGAAAFEEPIAALIRAFPDAQWKVEELIGEGDKVIVRQQLQGTHTAQFQHIAATGKKVVNNGIAIYELKAGKIISGQVQTDRLGFLQELGVLPVDLTSLSPKKEYKDKISFIDKFLIPAVAKAEFYERMHINRNLIKKIPGFIEDAAYEYTDNNGNLICVTVAQWENKEALNKAREIVQAEYKKQGFDMPAMLKRLNIVVDRGIYTSVSDQ